MEYDEELKKLRHSQAIHVLPNRILADIGQILRRKADEERASGRVCLVCAYRVTQCRCAKVTG